MVRWDPEGRCMRCKAARDKPIVPTPMRATRVSLAAMVLAIKWRVGVSLANLAVHLYKLLGLTRRSQHVSKQRFAPPIDVK